MRTNITFDLMCDRQDLIPLMETRRLGLEPYMIDRTDMYWAKVHVTDDGLTADLSYCIDPDHKVPGAWHLSFQYGSKLLDTQETRDKVAAKWGTSIEKLKADTWAKNLIDAGYFDHGRAYSPHVNAAQCPHCKSLFEVGTSHPHTWLIGWNSKDEKRLIYHHKLMEKTIKELGLVKQGVSGLPDIPSLEELGELEAVIMSK